MKNETKENFGTTAPFTLAALETLKSKGFQYVQVKGFTRDRRLDYMEPHFLVLIPLKELPAGGNIEIYESINSKLLLEWAAHPRDRMEILVSLNKSKHL